MAENNTTDQGAPVDTSTSATINAAAHAYQVAMEENNVNPNPVATATTDQQQPQQSVDNSGDVVMSDRVPSRHDSPAIIPGATPNADSPAPHRTGTPLRNTNGNDVTSRANSQHPEPALAAQAFPKQATLHGAPTRQYLNSKVTTALLEGMKQIAKDQPKDPLRVLGEFLLQKSREVEGTS